MKTIIALILITIAGSAIIFTAGKNTGTEVSVLRDITEPHLAKLDTSEIFHFYGTDKWGGRIFRFTDISDVSYSRTRQTSIEAENQWLSNEYEREDKIEKLNDDIGQIVADSQKTITGKPYSSIYNHIARELTQLTQIKAQRKILLIYSDLMENQKDFSFYNSRTFNLLQTNPNEIQQLLEKNGTLSRLDGIEIYMVYEPVNSEKDRAFGIVSEFYRNLLESKGAKVFIGANLIN